MREMFRDQIKDSIEKDQTIKDYKVDFSQNPDLETYIFRNTPFGDILGKHYKKKRKEK